MQGRLPHGIVDARPDTHCCTNEKNILLRFLDLYWVIELRFQTAFSGLYPSIEP